MIILVTSGCSTAPIIYKMYSDSEELPKEQVVRLIAHAGLRIEVVDREIAEQGLVTPWVRIKSVDGEKIPNPPHTHIIELLPGLHRIEIYYYDSYSDTALKKREAGEEFIIDSGAAGAEKYFREEEGKPLIVDFIAEAGKIYYVIAEIDLEKRFWKARVEEATEAILVNLNIVNQLPCY